MATVLPSVLITAVSPSIGVGVKVGMGVSVGNGVAVVVGVGVRVAVVVVVAEGALVNVGSLVGGVPIFSVSAGGVGKAVSVASPPGGGPPNAPVEGVPLVVGAVDRGGMGREMVAVIDSAVSMPIGLMSTVGVKVGVIWATGATACGSSGTPARKKPKAISKKAKLYPVKVRVRRSSR